MPVIIGGRASHVRAEHDRFEQQAHVVPGSQLTGGNNQQP